MDKDELDRLLESVNNDYFNKDFRHRFDRNPYVEKNYSFYPDWVQDVVDEKKKQRNASPKTTSSIPSTPKPPKPAKRKPVGKSKKVGSGLAETLNGMTV